MHRYTARHSERVDETQPHIVPAVPESGSLLGGRYRLAELLGQGGVADVFRARDEMLQRDVAVKLFRPDASALDDERRRQGEMRVLASLNHPGLVTVFDAGRDETQPGVPRSFLVLELVDGVTLARRIADGPVSMAAVAHIGCQLADALAYVHLRGVVHRGVKPANVLLTEPDAGQPGHVVAKLTDFGIARLLDGSRLTMHGMTVGTAQYLSPEQARGHNVGPPSDVYSLGLSLLECLTGEVAYPGSAIEAAAARLHSAPPLPDEFGEAWTDLLKAMTAIDPAARPTTAQAAETLRQLSAGASASPLDQAAATSVMAALMTPGGGLSTETAARPAFAPDVSSQVFPSAPVARRRPSRLAAILAVLGLLVAAVVVTLIIRSGSARTAERLPPPAYPSVPANLGIDLHELQQSVQ